MTPLDLALLYHILRVCGSGRATARRTSALRVCGSQSGLQRLTAAGAQRGEPEGATPATGPGGGKAESRAEDCHHEHTGLQEHTKELQGADRAQHQHKAENAEEATALQYGPDGAGALPELLQVGGRLPSAGPEESGGAARDTETRLLEWASSPPPPRPLRRAQAAAAAAPPDAAEAELATGALFRAAEDELQVAKRAALRRHAAQTWLSAVRLLPEVARSERSHGSATTESAGAARTLAGCLGEAVAREDPDLLQAAALLQRAARELELPEVRRGSEQALLQEAERLLLRCAWRGPG